jgi:general secretion pathway protein M
MTASPISSQNFLRRASSHWQELAPREKALSGAAVALLAAALVWWLAVAPALAVLKTAATQRGKLEVQLQQMQGLQAQAKALQALPKIKSNDASRALEALVELRLGATARLTLAGSQVTMTLAGASADALAQFLGQARAAANALPIQARLRRSASNPQSWDGTLVLSLPAE